MTSRCDICPRRCDLGTGSAWCGAYTAGPNGPIALFEGHVAHVSVDPIEKKPIWHDRAGTRVLSLGTWGCTLRCRHCLNGDLAWTRKAPEPERVWTPEDVVARMLATGCAGVAWTTTEAATWWPFVIRASVAVREAGGFVVLVTNGFYTREALAQLLPHLDVWRVDLKAWDEPTYRTLLGAGDVENAAAECRARTQEAHAAGVHVEIVTCLIPGHHDTTESLQPLADWIRDTLGPETPWHLLRFHPQHLMRGTPAYPADAARTMAQAMRDRGLSRVHVGGEATRLGPGGAGPRRSYDFHGQDGRFVRLVMDEREGFLGFVGDEDLLEEILGACRSRGLDLSVGHTARCG